ncbi:MAG: PQQ-dependent sugar dehydrogenase [Verrucomicrobia bacterium]|nr:PQQ-dependent sugar dehydrogenase [Verrucomicrobiota bacterium]
MRTLPALLFAACALTASAQLVRQGNSTLTLPAAPPSQGYALATPFAPGSTADPAFNFPVKIVTPPGDPANRVFVVERTGLIKVYDPAVPTTSPATFMDLTDRVASSTSQGEERGLLGLAFHPQWATNGYFYAYYSNSTSGANQRVARYQFTGGNPSANTGDRTTEVLLFRQADPASNHNGGDIAFGADGYLYISVGDGGGANDSTNNSQKLDGGLFSGIFRIDVDRRAGNLEPNTPNPTGSVLTIPQSGGFANYKIPADNPFIGATSFNGTAIPNTAYVRTEYWAIGLRNPWRMHFDQATNRLYAGDVGQGAREEIDLIVKGANYGWKFYEGFTTTGLGTIPSSGFTHTPPLIDYPRSDGFAVTGGLVYRGTSISQLYGQYIFADYGGGFWHLQIDPTTGANIGSKISFGVTPSLPVAFGTDPRNGDVLIAQLGNASGAGRIRRLVVSGSQTGSLPATLSATGAFSDLASLTPNPGIVAYEPNVSFWSDHATKKRWFSVPNVNDKVTFTPTGAWSTPNGSVFIKHFDIATPTGNRRLETRFIVRTSSGIYGATYKWNAAGTDADLVPDEGASETLQVLVNNTTQTQTWTYPSRASCLNCHTQVAGYTLSFNANQLNNTNTYNGQSQNQIEALSAAGYFANPSSVPSVLTIPKFAKIDDNNQSVEWRVRSYLAVNCVSCHQPGGLGVGNWDARHTTKTADAGLINGPLVNDLGNAANRVLVPNDLARSVMYQRIASAGGAAYHMPPIATNVTNTAAANLLSQWITGDLTTYQSFAQWQVANFGSTSAPQAQATADPDGDGLSNRFEYLTGTGANNAASRWSMSIVNSHGETQLTFPRIANRRFLALVSTDLQTWTPWNVPTNTNGVSATSFTDTISGPFDPQNPQFFRLQIDEP